MTEPLFSDTAMWIMSGGLVAFLGWWLLQALKPPPRDGVGSTHRGPPRFPGDGL